MSEQHVVALGGCGFSMEESPVLDDDVLALSRNLHGLDGALRRALASGTVLA